MKLEMHADAMLLKGKGVTLSIVEYQGKTEVVVQGKKQNVRILNDNDGLHVEDPKPNRRVKKSE